MIRILVTGGAGFIGTHTCLSLLENKFNLIVVDSFTNSSKRSLEKVIELLEKKYSDIKERIKIFNGDIKNEDWLNEIFVNSKKENKPIFGVIHFAGLKAVAESVRNPLGYWEGNLVSSISLLKVMQKNKCFTIVFSSSATIYRTTSELIKEEFEKEPINPYGQTKLSIEKMLHNLYESDIEKWKVINLRYFNPIGAHYSGIIGESPLGIPNNIFPIIGKVAIGLISKLSIFGNDWPTRDGTCIRDYIHVMDLAEGHVQALNFLLENKACFININLGTGKGTTVLELVKAFENTNKITIPYEFAERRIGDNPITVADNTKALAILKWEAKRSLDDMCRDGWEWFKRNPEGY